MDKPPPATQKILLLLLSTLFFSCSQTSPSVNSVEAYVVFDFDNEISKPQQRLSVFVNLESEVQRTSAIIVKNKENSYIWNVSYPSLISAGDSQWAGYTNIVPCTGETIPQGFYTVTYCNALGETVDSSFSISYNKDLCEKTSNEAVLLLGNIKQEKIAIYSHEGMLLFFDAKKRQWTNDEKIWAEFKDATSYRTCYTLGKTMCLMPYVYKEALEEENGRQ